MKRTAYGQPLLLSEDNRVLPLVKTEAVSEVSIQDLIFSNPECLPISDIDEAYNPVIPICKELRTPVGPLDILMVTPNGEITIIETKLWRNPEARRKVIAQALDYAKELSNWTYSDLQREINRNLNRKGNTLYEIAKASNSHLVPPESDFVDSVSRNLERGRFLLLIAGDGIKENAIGITEFLSNAGHLNFTFAMVELNIYKAEGLGTLIIPKTLVKTVDLHKFSVDIPRGMTISKIDQLEESAQSGQQLSAEKEQEQSFYKKFWQELLAELSFDDPSQPLPSPGNAQNLYVYPGNTKKAWISAYFMKSQKRVGVYFRAQNDSEGNDIISSLGEDVEDIIAELEELNAVNEANWNQVGDLGIRLSCEDVLDPQNSDTLKEFFQTQLNNYVNVFRPRMKRMGY